MRNIELKIQVPAFKEVISRLRKHRAREKNILHQIDTYYNCAQGRLKFREENDKIFQLVFYIRPDKKEAKVSNFDVIDFKKTEAMALKSVLKMAYGEKVIVDKKRKLWMYKNTRIHLDKVEKLGTFLELETQIKNGLASAKKEYAEIVVFLELDKYKKLDRSYSDMLIKNTYAKIPRH